MKTRTLIALSLILAGCNRVSTPVPRAGLSRSGGLPPALLQDVERETFRLISSPAGLPSDTGSALAAALGQTRLVIAAPGEEWSGGCLVKAGAPRHRLRFAAVSS